MAKKPLRDIVKKTAHSKGDEKFIKAHNEKTVTAKNDKPTENDKMFTVDMVSVQDSDSAHKGSDERTYDSMQEEDLSEGHGMFRANTYGSNNESKNDGKKYKIVRFHKNGPKKTITKGVSLSYAQSHCSHPETSSKTCKSKNAKAYTRRHGDWFDGYEKQ